VTVGVPSYKGFRFPAEIISHCVWLYYRFPLSLREVEEMMLARGITLSHETVRQWCAKFGQTYANGLRRRRPRLGDKWHLDEVFITINGQRRYLWRAVDQHGTVLDILVTSRRGTVNLAMIMIYFFFATPRCSSSSRADTTTGCGSKIRIDQL
jgi:putative transposase